MGNLAILLASLVLGQPGYDYVADRTVQIPIDFKDSVRSELKELLLFASWDEGNAYQQVARIAPDKTAFVFQASTDGNCWLKVAVIDRQGKQIPPDLQKGGPDRKIVIDTMKPVVKTFVAQRQGDDVEINWEILESHFNPADFRIEYQPKDNPSAFWSAVSATPGLTGKTRFRPSSSSPISLRLSSKDLAGNASAAYADLSGTISTASYSAPAAQATAPPIAPPAAPTTTGALPPPLPPPSASDFPPAVAPMPPAPTVDNKALSSTAVPHPAPVWTPPAGVSPESKDRLVASSDQPPLPKAPVVAPASSQPPVMEQPRRPAPPRQYVNHPEVLLEYSLSKVGKSGVSSVDLYWTRNDGQTWDLYASDKKIEGTKANGKQEATVELPGEGVYGFSLVVKSKAGLGKAPPKPGDTPEIVIEVDTTLPLAQLYAPVPDKRTGHLVLKWVATDKNLANNPITLEWAQVPGEWHPIVKDHPNIGSYNWQLPENLPVEVYMRLRVRDLAGNESIAVTQDPQLVDLSEPEGNIINASAFRR